MVLAYILGGIFGLVLFTCLLCALLISGELERAPALAVQGDLREAVHYTTSSALRPWIL